MSSILHPFQAASQKCRPKHQVLILRCYPQYQKNVQEIKPNSSELSYLLYYASTQRNKLQKVGAFLEKKSANDVWRQKLGNVQVTLQILTALIEKTPRDISLYANSVLTIIDNVLRSKDINMVEETLPTFEAYCKHVDVPSLIADQVRTKQYLSIVQIYSSFASPDHVGKGRTPPSVPVAIRWRTVSLRAIRAVVGSDAIAADSSTQLNSVMPVILENLFLEDGEVLKVLQERAQTSEKQSTEIARRRRLSIATVTTIDTTDANPAMASETTAVADKVAEDEVRVLAVRCLKQIFSISTSSNRGQTRLATALTLKFIAAKQRPQSWLENEEEFQGGWAASLFEAIARWTPVQDRFVIVLTAMETLARSPIIESVLEKQLVLAQMIDHLLRSDVNLIGLSVMDILLGLVQHTLLLLQLGGRDSKISSSPPHQDVLGIFAEAKETFDANEIVVQPDMAHVVAKDEATASPTRKHLLDVLERCISNLSNHIYYTDQVTDMITAILARLKPTTHSEVSSFTAAINNPAATSKSIADSASLREDSATDSFFSFATARVIALRAVKGILTTANNSRAKTGAGAEARSRVGILVWEGTQWLLKDEDFEVRIAYVDALMTWLKFETNKASLLLPQDNTRKNRLSKRPDMEQDELKLAKRAVSNASRKGSKVAQSSFVQLLHLAVYDNALELADTEQDLLLLHLLLTTMVEKLGVNVIRNGLPMIMELQNTALNEGSSDRSARSKVNIASLVSGYLMSMVEKFNLQSNKAGQEVNSQIAKRKQLGTWVDRIRLPALQVDQIRALAENEKLEYETPNAEALKPFLDVNSLVDGIADAYDDSLFTPPSSPALSPARVFSVPSLGFGYGYGAAPAARPAHKDQMPQKVKDEMMGQWSRESCIASVNRERSNSLAGSRTGGSSARKQHLTVFSANGEGSGRETPASPTDTNNPAPVQPLTSGLGSLNRHRFSGWSGSALHLTNSSSHDSTVRVSDLKRALSGVNIAGRNDSPLRRPFTASRRSLREADTDSESMMSWDEGEDGDGSVVGAQTPRPGTSTSKRDGHSVQDQIAPNEDIPPVPKIPSVLNLPGTWPRDHPPSKTRANGVQADTNHASTGTRHIVITSNAPFPPHQASSVKRSSRPTSKAGTASIRSQTYTVASTKPVDVKAALAGFLAGIEAETMNGNNESTKEVGRKRLVAPPY